MLRTAPMIEGESNSEDVDELVDGGPPAAAELRTLGELRYWCVARPDHLYVRYAGVVSDVATANVWLAAIDELLVAHGVARVLWESRPAQGHPPAVRERIWEWLHAQRFIRVSAIVVRSDMLRISANMSSVGSTLRLKAFGNVAEARAWLLAQPA